MKYRENNFRKKGLSIVLSLAMALSLLAGTGLSAYAADPGCDHRYVAGRCIHCGDILPAYEWYYGEDGGADATEFTIRDDTEEGVTAAEEMAALADIVNTDQKEWEAYGTFGDTFAGKTVNLAGSVDMGGLPADAETGSNWTPIGGAGDRVDLEIRDQEDLDAAIEKYVIVYDSAGNSYVKGSPGNGGYNSSVTYYYYAGDLFEGTFNGNENSIFGMLVNTDEGYCGLFGNVGGTICDFSVEGSVTTTTRGDYAAGACAKLAAGGTVSGVTADVEVTAKNGYNIGGVVGFVGEPGGGTPYGGIADGSNAGANAADPAQVTECVNRGTVSGNTRVGGIAGRNAGIISECANFGDVDNLSGQKNGTGGITGMNGVNNTATDGGIVQDCYNAGYVDGETGYWTGGIVGFQNAWSITQNCYNSSNLGIYKSSGDPWSHSNPGIGQNEGTAYKVYGIAGVAGSEGSGGTVDTGSGGTVRDCVFFSADDMKKIGFYNALNTRYGDTEGTGLWSFDPAAKDMVNEGYVVLAWQVSDAVYGVDYAVDGNVTADVTRYRAPKGEEFTTTLVPAAGYSLTADDITVTVSGRALEAGKGFTYAAESGTLTVFSGYVTGDITITATAKKENSGSGGDASGADTLCVRRGAVYYFSYTIHAGDADLETVYGHADDTVLFGDWDGDGVDTYCVRRGAEYYFRNSLTSGNADEVIVYGRADDDVLVGDWDGDGKDTQAVRRGRVYYLANSIKSGNADQEIVYGRESDDVIVGDWDGDGKDTPAVRRGAQYFFQNTFTGGEAEYDVVYGHADDVVLVGDWDGDGKDTLAVRRGAEYYFKNSISAGDADEVVVYGRADDEVYAGRWR